jgi:hypothetical protein
VSNKDREITLRVPDEAEVLRCLLVSFRLPYMADDLREVLPATRFSNARVSEKGRYLKGLLKTLGGLLSAEHLLSQRYWRRMFQRLSNRDTRSDERNITKLRKRIADKILGQPSSFKDSEDFSDWLALTLLKVSHDVRQPGKVLRYEEFEAEARKEAAELNAEPGTRQPWDLSPDALHDILSDLVADKVLWMGITVQCRACGLGQWRPLQEMRQHTRCTGCGGLTPIGAEARWEYRLNNLVQAACTEHGQTVVVLCLGHLFHRGRDFFAFAPSIDVFDTVTGQDEKLLDDIDIVAVADGQLILGEVKETAGGFGASDFEWMLEVGRRIRPDVLVFSTLEQQPVRPFVLTQIARLRQELEPLRVQVEWVQLSDHVFEPQPVR